MADGTISIDVELNEKAFKISLENMGGIVKSGTDTMVKSVNNLSGSFVLLPNTINSIMNSVPNILNRVINTIAGKNPVMTKTGTEFFTAIIGEMPSVTKKVTGCANDITNGVVKKFIDVMPNMSDTGNKFFKSFISNQPEIIAGISDVSPKITKKIIQSFTKDEPLISQAGFDLFCSLTRSLPSATKEISQAPGEIVSTLLNRFNSLTGQFKSVGVNIVHGVWSGMSSMGGWLQSAVTGFFQGIVNSVTGFLGISSPSKLFRDLVGKNIALGVKSGIDNQMPDVITGTKTQMSRLAAAATQSARIDGGAADIIGRANTAGTAELNGLIKTRFGDANENVRAATPEINVTLEPTGDIRGFFDYIRMGVKRSGYLNGDAKI